MLLTDQRIDKQTGPTHHSLKKLKEHVAFDRSSWSLNNVKERSVTVCYKKHMGRKML